jgi:hypothetical protein
MRPSFLTLTILTLVIASGLGFPVQAAGEVVVVTGPDAPALDRYAASELRGYLKKLFDVDATAATSLPSAPAEVFLIGNPTTNPLIAKAEFPDLTDQGFILKSAKLDDHPVLLVGGGSPQATLWAVYDLVERWGVCYLLHGDVLPATKSFQMQELNLKQEPNLRIRQWRVLNEHAMGPISWGIADYRPVIDQLAKLKFNRLLLYIWPGQPFLPLEYKGIRQTSGTLFFGNHYPITDDMIGRSLFGQETEYWNPDLPLLGDPEKLTAAAVKHVQNLITYAHERGMACVMPAHLTEFPKEYKPLLKHTHPVDMVGTPTIGPGADADADVDDPALAGLARAVLETTIKTYPGIDYIALDLPEWREWVNQYERAWKALDAKYSINEIRLLADVLSAAEKRKDYSGGSDRAVKEVKADIVALYFYDKLISDPTLNIAPGKFVMSTVAEELFPILARILPKGSETLNFVDYTPSRIVRRRDVLKDIPAHEIASVLIYTLHDDNVGVLPQLATHSLAELTKDIGAQGWAGFSTRYWLIGDHDPCVAFLSRAAWDPSVTPDDVYRDQLSRICGDAAVGDMLKVFSEVEAATITLEWHGLGLTFTTPNMMMQHWTPGTMSAELKTVSPRYQAALDAARRALEKSEPAGKSYINYWIGRLEFGIAYMAAIEAVHSAATAEAAKDNTLARREATRALDLIKQALTSYASVARDRSDKGAIAVMNEYVYRALTAKIGMLKDKISATTGPAVRAVDFQSRKVYQSKQRPSYTSWATFFPGEKGQWYLGCEEVTTPDKPRARASTQFVYEMSLPRGYDKSKHQMELVLLRSDDQLKTWNVISREEVKATGGSFAQARTRDGNFLRFVWACYSLDPSVKPNEIYQRSTDDGKTWKKMPPFVSNRFAWYPHRLRTLRDGTLVLCCPRASKWGKGTDYPIRAAMRLDTVSDMEMMLFISQDQGKTWSNPLPIFSGQTVSETDFVELPDGNLLFINNSIFATPGRQFVYRDGNRFTPGPLERVHSGAVPETICLTEEGVLIGCHRPGTYHWSNDLGQNWRPLDGAPSTIEVYQPWIQYLGNNKVACAGHLGADDPIGARDQYISIHTFNVQVQQKTSTPKLWIERGYDATKKSFLNTYTISLTSNDAPLPDKDIQVWYVARDQPGYDSYNSKPLADRMKAGGKSITLHTDANGKATLDLPEFNAVTDIHASYQMVIRFNPDGQYPDYRSAELPQLEYYANSGLDP